MRDTVAPRFGTSSTLTRHVPVDLPRTADPANSQRDAPETMLMRIVPCDLRGMARPAAFAIVAALTVRPRRTVTRRLGFAVDVTAPVVPVDAPDAGDTVVEVVEVLAIDPGDAVAAGVIAGAVVGDVTGGAVAGGAVVGTVVGAAVGGTVVGATVGTVVGAGVTESAVTVAGASRAV